MIDFGDVISEWLSTQQELDLLRVCCAGQRSTAFCFKGSTAFCFKEGINVHVAQVSLDGTVWTNSDRDGHLLARRLAGRKTKLDVADPEFFNKLHKILTQVLFEKKPYYVKT